MPHRATVGRDMALGLSQPLPAEVHSLQAGVIRQTGIQLYQSHAHCVRASVIGDHHQSTGLRLTITEYHGLSDPQCLDQFTFQPFRADVASKAGDQQVLGPATDGQKALCVLVAQIAGIQPVIRLRLITEIPQMGIAPNQNPVLVIHLYLHMPQGKANRAFTFRSGDIQRHHRATFGQTVALVQRQPNRPGPGQQVRRYPAAADRQKAK